MHVDENPRQMKMWITDAQDFGERMQKFQNNKTVRERLVWQPVSRDWIQLR